MKKIVKLAVAVLSLFFISGCAGNMFGDIGDDIGEYNYFLAVTNYSANGKIYIYSVGGTGVVSNVWTSPATLDNRMPMYIAAHPSGNYIYIPYQGVDWLGVYRINSDASLTFVSSYGVTSPYAVKVHPSGNYVYCTFNSGGYGYIASYKVNGDGTLTLLSTTNGINFTTLQRMAINPNADILYVSGVSNSNIRAYSISNDGSLSLNSIASSSVASLMNITDIAVDKDSNVYFSSDSGVGTWDMSSVVIRSAIPVGAYMSTHPAASYLYAARSSVAASYYDFQINSGGSLTQLANGPNSADVREIVIHPNSRYLYATQRGPGNLQCIMINDDGSLNTSSFQQVSSLGNPMGLALIRKKK